MFKIARQFFSCQVLLRNWQRYFRISLRFPCPPPLEKCLGWIFYIFSCLMIWPKQVSLLSGQKRHVKNDKSCFLFENLLKSIWTLFIQDKHTWVILINRNWNTTKSNFFTEKFNKTYFMDNSINQILFLSFYLLSII